MSPTIESMSALQAIEKSEREDRIVHLRWSPQLAADLLADCDGSCDGNGYADFWGDEPNDETNSKMSWRVYLHRDNA